MAVEFDPIKGVTQLAMIPAMRNLPHQVHISGLDEEFADTLEEQLAKGRGPVLASSHTGFPDGMALAHVADGIVGIARQRGMGHRLSGFSLTVAASLISGEQGIVPQKLWQVWESYLNKRHVHSVGYTREIDSTKFRMKHGFGDVAGLIRGLGQYRGIGLFPAGNMEAGRSDGHGGIKGMQEVSNEHLMGAINLVSNAKKSPYEKAFIITIGLSNAHRLMSSDSKFLTWEALWSLYLSQPQWGIEMSAKVGKIITPEMMAQKIHAGWETDYMAINNLVMGRIAGLVEPEARGFYADKINPQETVPVLN